MSATTHCRQAASTVDVNALDGVSRVVQGACMEMAAATDPPAVRRIDVIGPSGAGKSSLITALLGPDLKRNACLMSLEEAKRRSRRNVFRTLPWRVRAKAGIRRIASSTADPSSDLLAGFFRESARAYLSGKAVRTEAVHSLLGLIREHDDPRLLAFLLQYLQRQLNGWPFIAQWLRTRAAVLDESGPPQHLHYRFFSNEIHSALAEQLYLKSFPPDAVILVTAPPPVIARRIASRARSEGKEWALGGDGHDPIALAARSVERHRRIAGLLRAEGVSVLESDASTSAEGELFRIAQWIRDGVLADWPRAIENEA